MSAAVNLGLSCIGFVTVVAGLALQFGAGWAAIVGGTVLFVVGGLGSAREGA